MGLGMEVNKLSEPETHRCIRSEGSYQRCLGFCQKETQVPIEEVLSAKGRTN